jgi:hypothetical protein
MDIRRLINSLTNDFGNLSERLAQMSPDVQAEKTEIVENLRKQFKKILSSRELTLH